MKNIFTKSFVLCAMLSLVWACDNFSEIPVVDLPPKITLGPITSGLTEKQDFLIEVTLNDGVDEGTLSTLALFLMRSPKVVQVSPLDPKI